MKEKALVHTSKIKQQQQQQKTLEVRINNNFEFQL